LVRGTVYAEVCRAKLRCQASVAEPEELDILLEEGNEIFALPVAEYSPAALTGKLGRAALQTAAPITSGTLLIVYIGGDGRLWCRPEAEFMDGRFEKVEAV